MPAEPRPKKCLDCQTPITARAERCRQCMLRGAKIRWNRQYHSLIDAYTNCPKMFPWRG